MKSVFITFNQAFTERIEFIFEKLDIKGFTRWVDVQGAGSISGEPRYGTHTWPEMNSAIITVIPDDKVKPLLSYIKGLDETNLEVGIRAFVWDVVDSY